MEYLGRKGKMGDGWSSTQHPLCFLRTHSRASFCAVEMSAGVICFARMSLFSTVLVFLNDVVRIPYY
jgi:hypothetical protein